MDNLSLNEKLLIWINQDWANPVFDVFFTWISMKAGFSFPLLLGIILYIGWRYGKTGWQFGLLLIVLTGLSDLIGNFLKDFFQHARPCLEYYELIRSPFEEMARCSNSTNGMPSNHTLNFFMVFTFISFFFPKTRIVIAGMTLAALVGISRIYLGQHFPAQVLAGWVTGMALGMLFAGLTFKLLPAMRFKNASRPDTNY